MRISKHAKKLANDLGLSEVDAYIMDLKAKLYMRSAKLIKNSEFNHEEIAKKVGTSRARITRIGNNGENNISIEMLLRIIAVLEGKAAIKIAA